ncbi:MAG: hypothetical protein ACJA1A_001274 [Saprospiraceae bacterium]|jgi:hypothetical protein
MIYRNILLAFVTLGICLSFSYAAIQLTKTPANSLLHVPLPADGSISTPISAILTEKERKNNAIQIALLLDTSGSMSGLIEQAKSQLWNILNELTKTIKGEDTPTLEIALYEYGNPSKSSNKYEIHQLSPFTTDMDLISEQLFSLRTNGGEEYCGAVIKESLDNLDWTNKDGLKMIYIAGNEPFTQGPIGYRKVCEVAQDRNIIVNTIYCSDGAKYEARDWRLGATAGGGEYFTINHNEATVFVETPYDDVINQLNGELNKTYHSFNSYGESKVQNLLLQDSNASSYSKENSAKRTKFKASKQYKTEDWDLVENYKNDKTILDKAVIKNERLSKLSKVELEAEIERMAQKREEVKLKINELDRKRVDYKKDKIKSDQKDNLGTSIIKTVRKQAKKKGYKVEE